MTPSDLPRVFRVSIEVDDDTGCWNWTASFHRDGYAQVWMSRRGIKVIAHRWAYHLLIDPDFPVVSTTDDTTLDHLCNNRRCVNPTHLEPISRSENSKRANEYRWHGITRHPDKQGESP